MNLFKAVMQPVNFCTVFLVCGGCIWRIDFYFVKAGLDTHGGDQTTKYLASHYSGDAFLWVEFELSFTHISESFRQVRNIRCFFLLATMMSST
jgi:hypothetical protein